MTSQSINNDDLGIESFESVYEKHFRPKQEEKSLINKAGESGAFGLLGKEEGRRHIARTGSRVIETLAGLPGDAKNLFEDVLIAIPESLYGSEIPFLRQVVKGPTKTGITGLSPASSKEIRENLTQPMGGEYLEPQNKTEQFADDISQDFAALAIPIKGKIPFVRALGTSLLANTTGEIAKEFGGDKAQAYTKLGTLFSASLIGGGKGVKNYINNLYSTMEKSIPEGSRISSVNLSNKLNKLESVLKKGDPSDKSKLPVFDKIKSVREKISDNNINVDELVELNKSINESIFESKGLKRSQNKLYDLREAIHETLGEYGKENADFLKNWKNANEAFAATEMSRKIGNWVNKNVGIKDLAYVAGALGLEGALINPSAVGGTIAVGGGIAGAAYTAEVLKRISQSPQLRKYYSNVVTNALNENKSAFIKNARLLNRELEKSFEKDPYETVEFD